MRFHRSPIAAVLTAAAVSALGVAPAAAEPAPPPVITTLTEQPAPSGQTAFTDTPAIVDSHPQSIESFTRLPDDRTLAVNFSTGTPECFGVHAEVQETADIIAVKLRSGTVPEAVGRACIMIAVFGTVTVPLNAPVGNRAVVSIT